AVRTCGDVTTFAALDERRVSATIEQQDALLALLETIRQRLLELLADHEPQPVSRFLLLVCRLPCCFPEVDHFDLRETPFADALGQRQQCVLPVARVGPTLE